MWVQSVVCADVARCGSGMSGMWAWLSWQLHDNGEAIISLLEILCQRVMNWIQLINMWTWSRAQEQSSKTEAFAPPDLLRGTVSKTSFTILLTLIYSDVVSKLYFSREHTRILSLTLSVLLNGFVNGACEVVVLYQSTFASPVYWLSADCVRIVALCW